MKLKVGTKVLYISESGNTILDSGIGKITDIGPHHYQIDENITVSKNHPDYPYDFISPANPLVLSLFGEPLKETSDVKIKKATRRPTKSPRAKGKQ